MKLAKKILIIANAASPLNRERGLAAKRMGHTIFWVSPVRIELPETTMFSPPAWLGRHPCLCALFMPVVLLWALMKVRPDLIHVFYAFKGLQALVLRLYQAPVVVTAMGSDIMPEQGCRGIVGMLTRTMLDRADVITTKSDFMDEMLAEIGEYQCKVKRVAWGVDLTRFAPKIQTATVARQFNIKPEMFVLLDPRAARPLYNKHIILQAYAEALKQIPQPSILIVSEFSGDPAYLKQLHSLVDELKINENVKFVNQIPHSLIPEYYALADVTVSVPSSDGFPQTIYEALACHSFLILGDLPQYDILKKEQTGTKYVQVGNVQALTNAMIWTANHKKELVKAAGSGRKFVEKFANSECEYRKLKALYESLLNPVRNS